MEAVGGRGGGWKKDIITGGTHIVWSPGLGRPHPKDSIIALSSDVT